MEINRRNFLKTSMLGTAGVMFGPYTFGQSQEQDGDPYADTSRLPYSDIPKDGFYKVTEKGPRDEDHEVLLTVFTQSSDWGDNMDARILGLKRARAVTSDKPYISLIARNSENHIDPTTGDITYKVAVFPSSICSKRGEKSFDNFLSGIPDF